MEDSLVGGVEEHFEDPTSESARQSLIAIRDSLLVLAPEVSTAVRLADAQIVPAPEPWQATPTGTSGTSAAERRRRVVVTAGVAGVGLQ